MNRLNNVFALGILILGCLVSAPSFAQHHFHGGPRVGVYLGTPWYGPAFYPPAYYPPAYYPPDASTVVVPSAPTTYVERVIVEPQPSTSTLSGPSAPAQPQWWHYCKDSQSFYPYVQQCASPWQLVAPQPQR